MHNSESNGGLIILKGERKSVWPSLWTVPIGPKAKLRTNWTKEVGRTSKFAYPSS